ncbi:MAG: hypothetical protein ACJ74U_08430 [Jatrophihabitantaceae bacterium]
MEHAGGPDEFGRLTLDRSDFVVRGNEGDDVGKVLNSMLAHHLDEEIEPAGEWGLSVACVMGATPDEIVKQAKQVRQRKFRVASVADFLDAGFVVKQDSETHGLILWPEEPGNQQLEQLVSFFGEAQVNPYYEERRGPRRAK